MVDVLSTLIDKQDSFELVRDQIGLILATETLNQQTLATAAAKDPNDWKLRVFLERSNPWEVWLNNQTDKSPIVNVWFDNGNFPMNRGDTVERQEQDGSFNIDCYGLGISSDLPAGGHTAGDKLAALEAQRAAKLSRNILMASINTYLQLRGIVGQRWVGTITVFQPQIDARPMHNIVGARIALRVRFDEFSPQFTPETLELISVEVKRTEDGQIMIEADYDQT